MNGVLKCILVIVSLSVSNALIMMSLNVFLRSCMPPCACLSLHNTDMNFPLLRNTFRFIVLYNTGKNLHLHLLTSPLRAPAYLSVSVFVCLCVCLHNVGRNARSGTAPRCGQHLLTICLVAADSPGGKREEAAEEEAEDEGDEDDDDEEEEEEEEI